MNYICQIGRITTCSRKIDSDSVEKMVDILVETKSKAGKFFLGVGGSAANACHAVNDFERFVAWKLMHQLIMCLN